MFATDDGFDPDSDNARIHAWNVARSPQLQPAEQFKATYTRCMKIAGGQLPWHAEDVDVDALQVMASGRDFKTLFFYLTLLSSSTSSFFILFSY